MDQTAVVFDPFNRTDERALINIVPTSFASNILSAHQAKPEYFGLEERGLWQLLRSQKLQPNPSDNRLRMKFWMEYDIAQSEGRRINLLNVVSGVCSNEYFHQKYTREPSKLAWLLTPPANYTIVAEEALQVGLETLRGYLEVDAAQNGKLDTKVAEVQLKIVALLDNRVKGAVVQKTMNLHASVPKGKIEAVTEERSMEALEKRLKAIEERRRKAQGAIIDASPVKPE